MNRAAAAAPAAVLSVSEPREKVRDIHEIRTAPSPQLTFATCTHEQERRGAWKWSHSHFGFFYVPPIMTVILKENVEAFSRDLKIIHSIHSFSLANILNLWQLGLSFWVWQNAFFFTFHSFSLWGKSPIIVQKLDFWWKLTTPLLWIFKTVKYLNFRA